MAREQGFRSLTVRALCLAAGANTGSFVYHFTSRERFITELIESWYAPFFSQLEWQSEQEQAPLDRLQSLLRQMLVFIQQHSPLLVQLALDVAAGEAPVRSFIASLAPRHPRLLLQCITEAQAAGQLGPAHPMHQMIFIMSAVGLPVLLQNMLVGKGVLPAEIETAFALFSADQGAVEQRLQWALKGLSTGVNHE